MSSISDAFEGRSQNRINLLAEMEKQFEEKNISFFEDLLDHEDNVIRTRAVCILAYIAGEKAIAPIGLVLKNDKNALVRHEAAFSLGQLGFKNGIGPLTEAVRLDPSFFVRHEAAVALGVIGSEEAREILVTALNDESEEVRESAVIALVNLDYLSKTCNNNEFTKLTGG
jgi:deoxyhypusine monooxygenase